MIISGKDQYGRRVAEVYILKSNSWEEIAVNGEMVIAGMAHYFERYNKADNAEMCEIWDEAAIARLKF